MGETELFNFFDENIPKIENTKLNMQSEKQQTSDIDIDSIAKMKITPELLSTLMQKIKNKEFNEEQSAKILSILKSHLNSTNTPVQPGPLSSNPLQPAISTTMYNNPMTGGNQPFITSNIPTNPYMNMGLNPMNTMNPMNPMGGTRMQFGTNFFNI
jgi:hypothetical protein